MSKKVMSVTSMSPGMRTVGSQRLAMFTKDIPIKGDALCEKSIQSC